MAAPGLTSDDLKHLKNKDPNSKQLARPKAYLNYVFFDKQLNFVEQGSGVKQVNGNDGELTTLTSGEVVAQKDGFVYVFTSNESEEDVLFDNLSVYQSTGPLLEETHYYPFGQTMAGISTVAPLKLANRYKYNGKEFNEKEFSDGTGLQWYSYGFRDYDPQIGRFIEQDPLTDNYATVGAYQYALNDPIANIDRNGLSVLPTVTVTAKAVERMSAFSGVTSKILGAASLAEKASNVASLASHIAGTAGSAINGLSITRAVGGQAGDLTEPDDWYENKKTGELKYFEGSKKHAGYEDLGKTYTGYVNISGKEYGFSGGANGSVILSSRLDPLNVIAPKSCRYCLGGAGAYGPWNPDAMGVSLSYGGALLGGYNFSLNIGFVGNRFGIWVTPAVSTGLFQGVGFSIFAAEYVSSAPMNHNSEAFFKSFMGAGYNINVGAGLNFGYGGDYSKDPKTGKLTLNSTWNIYSIGILGAGIEGDWGYSISLFNIGF